MTDHRSLSWLLTAPLVKGRLATWSYKLRSHDFTIVYRKGSENGLADFLSRTVHSVSPVRESKDSIDAARSAEVLHLETLDFKLRR